MSQTKAQLIQPVGIFTAPGVNVSGTLTATTFSGNLTGNANSLAGTPNLNLGIVTATTLYGSGANLTGVAAAGYVGQTTAAQSGTTTINLALGNVVYFTQNVDTIVAFANTSSVQEVRFIRTKDDTATVRTITWPNSIVWNGGSAPTLINSSQSGDAQIFNLTTRDSGVTWYGYEEFSYSPPVPYELWSWGPNSAGQLGINNTVVSNYSSPIQIPGNQWASLSVSQYGLATKNDGTLWSWGYNNNGQLALNDRVQRSSPTQIPGTQWNSISGNYQILATKTDGTLWAWGSNAAAGFSGGQLGLNDNISRSSPTQIPGTQWNKIHSGDFYLSSAIKTDGTAWVWGSGYGGQSGINDTINRSSPTQIPGTQWNSIKPGRAQTLSTKTDGTLWAWGINGNGQLGQNTTIEYSSPRQIPGTQWSYVNPAEDNFCSAIKTDNTLWTWGRNTAGRLGLNDEIDRSSPHQIPGTQWGYVDLGAFSGIASKTDGTLWSWGYGSSGQLGQNNTVQRSSPTQIPGTQWSNIMAHRVVVLAIKQG